MPELPTPSAREVIRALSGQGFQVVSQKGSHIKMKKIAPNESVLYCPRPSGNSGRNLEIQYPASRNDR